ncbi:hypothetical protein STEG23_016063, partial [Scotinomys teguina]
MAAMLLPGMKGSLLLVQRTVTRTIELQESIGKDFAYMYVCVSTVSLVPPEVRRGYQIPWTGFTDV